MKHTLIATALLISIPCTAFAQAQMQTEDGRISIYRQLLTQSNDNIVSMAAQLNTAQDKIRELQAQIDKRKAEDDGKK